MYYKVRFDGNSQAKIEETADALLDGPFDAAIFPNTSQGKRHAEIFASLLLVVPEFGSEDWKKLLGAAKHSLAIHSDIRRDYRLGSVGRPEYVVGERTYTQDVTAPVCTQCDGLHVRDEAGVPCALKPPPSEWPAPVTNAQYGLSCLPRS